MTKVFTVKVLGLTGTPVKVAEWDFTTSNIALSNDTTTVKDIQTGFVGKLVNEARIRTIGSTTQYNVLDLGNGTGYFDMGKEIGKAIYSLSDYTMMGYFRIDADYPSINTNGNFYWTFSNTAAAMTDQTGLYYRKFKSYEPKCFYQLLCNRQPGCRCQCKCSFGWAGIILLTHKTEIRVQFMLMVL